MKIFLSLFKEIQALIAISRGTSHTINMKTHLNAYIQVDVKRKKNVHLPQSPAK